MFSSPSHPDVFRHEKTWWANALSLSCMVERQNLNTQYKEL